VLGILQSDTTTPIVAEEDEASHVLIESAGSYYLVDPLDGTTSCRRFLGERGGQIGYGPLVGFVKDDQLSVASFFSAPLGKIFTAVQGEGTYEAEVDFSDLSKLSERRRLKAEGVERLVNAGVLFYLGTLGEGKVMQLMRDTNAIENMYRFGGFASDCARLARGTEQVSVQFAVKPWDFTGVLLSSEAGLNVYMDPLTRRTPLSQWKIERNNPVIITHPSVERELFALLGKLA
jgi:fructose-1,6-bisphosphatase/inositol monophosphatase family enzyme